MGAFDRFRKKKEATEAEKAMAGAEMMDREREIEKKEETTEEEKKKELEESRGGSGRIPEGYTRCSNPLCPGKYGLPEVYLVTETRCPVCHTPNRDLILEPNETICPFCKAKKKKKEEYCPNCKKRDPSYVRPTSLGEATGKKLNTAKIYELIIYELAGIFVIFGLPFFGLPSMPYLGIVLMAIFPFYSFLPSEHETINSIERGEEGLSAWAAGSLMVKGIVKTGAFVLTVIQFIVLPVSKLIPLAISFVYYFTLPVSYKVTQPFKMIEAWFRVGVGGLISWFMLMAFASTPQAWSLALMSAAFFCTSFPRHKEAPDERGVARIEILDKAGLKYLKGQLEIPLKIIFFFLMAAAWAVSGITIGTSSIQIIFIAVWVLSLFSGLATGSEGRPALGILMIGITLFVFTFTATGVMGQAVFGYWWPQVESFGESIAAPIAPMWEQVQTGMGDAWLMLTNPMAYYDQMTKKQQATKSVVKEGGTTKSIELTKTDLFTSVTGELEPRLDPLIGSFEIQNQGEFDANRIDLTLWATWQNPQKLDEVIKIGQLEQPPKFSCSQPALTSSVSGGQGTCNWTNTTYPQEIKVVNFVFYSNNQLPNTWSLSGSTDSDPDLSYCVVTDKDGNDLCTPHSVTCCDNQNATYKHSGQTIKVNVNLTYDYNVNVSIPVEVINQTKYENLLQARQITLQELTSQYTGGPVKATLWSQKQPVRDSGELSLFVASIINEGSGTLNQIRYFTILIPTDLAHAGNIEIVAQTFKKTAGPSTPFDGCSNANSYPHPFFANIGGKEYWVINCTNAEPMKTGEYKRVSFFITPDVVIDRKTSLIVGLANYEYIKTGSTSIKIANAPWH